MAVAVAVVEVEAEGLSTCLKLSKSAIPRKNMPKNPDRLRKYTLSTLPANSAPNILKLPPAIAIISMIEPKTKDPTKTFTGMLSPFRARSCIDRKLADCNSVKLVLMN